MARPKSLPPYWYMAPVRSVIDRALQTYGASLDDLARGPYDKRSFAQRKRLLYRVRTERVSAGIAVQVVNMALNSPVARRWRLRQRGSPRSDPARLWRRIVADLFMVSRDSVEVARWIPIEATTPIARLAVRLLREGNLMRRDGDKAEKFLADRLRGLLRGVPVAAPTLTIGLDGRVRGLPATAVPDPYLKGPDFSEMLP